MVWKEYRSVVAGPVELDGLDMDITVRKPKKDPLEFDVIVWNLSIGTWDRISDGDLLQVELGWEGGETDVVTLGEINHSERNPDGTDMKYRLKGVDDSEAATSARVAAHYTDRDPADIASRIATEIGLSADVEPAGRAIPSYSITKDQKVRSWLDELLEYAATYSGLEYEWFADTGRLHFVPRDVETKEAPELRYGSTLMNFGPKSSSGESDVEEYELEALLDPRIKKGAVVYVKTEEYEGAYRVQEYELKSSTTSGDHEIRATVSPVDATYQAPEPRRSVGRGLIR